MSAPASASSPQTARPDAATYTVADLAALLKCSPRHIHRLTDARRIPGLIRVGRLVRYSRTRVDEWVAKGGR